MHEILHILGICPDHFTHVNIFDIAIILYSNPGFITSSFFGLFNFAKNMFR